MDVTMVIVWAVVVAATLMVEFLSGSEFVSLWFSVGSFVALVLAGFGVDINIQVVVFVIGSGVMLALFRPIAKKMIKNPTVATNADAEIGREVKLASDVVDGKATANFNGTFWTVRCKEELKKGDMVKITEINGNTFKVKKAEA